MTKLKALRFENINSVNDSIDENICPLINSHYFAIRVTDFIDGIVIPDCIGKEWKHLRYFELTLSYNSLNGGYITPDIYSLPNIRTIIILFWPLSTESFINFNDLNTNTLASVYLSPSLVCESHPSNDNMTYLDFMAQNNSQLVKLIDKYDPCFEPCGSITDGATCTGIDWGNGGCNRFCFNDRCGYDNGDCNQICECGDTLNDGHQGCNETCNTENCNWDLFRCVNRSAPCYSDENDSNSACYTGWILEDDGWCDDNCRFYDSCLYDNSICQGCTGNCLIAYSISIATLASQKDPVTLITMDEMCDSWNLIKYVL